MPGAVDDCAYPALQRHLAAVPEPEQGVTSVCEAAQGVQVLQACTVPVAPEPV